MDAEYFIKIIIEGRDNISGPLQKSVASLRSELAALKGEMKGYEQQLGTTAVATGRANTATKSRRDLLDGERTAALAATKAAGTFRQEIAATTHTMDSHTASLRKNRTGLLSWLNPVFTARQALNGFRRGLLDAEKGVRDLDATLKKSQGTAFNFFYGLAQGGEKAFQSFTKLNTGLAFLMPIIFTALGAIVNLAGALVAVSSAAAMAAAALGGALVSALGTMVPIATVLVSVFERLKLVFQASTLMQKGATTGTQQHTAAVQKHKLAVEALANAQYNLKHQYQTIRDDVLNLKQAEVALSDARRQAARNIVDARFNVVNAILSERDASLSLAEAKLNLINVEKQQYQTQQDQQQLHAMIQNAKEELAAARATGNQAAIVAAEQALGIAQQEAATVTGVAGQQQRIDKQRAVLGVAQAQERVKESRVNRIRAIQDANRAERLGIANAPGVVAAQRAVRQSAQALAQAYHELAIRAEQLQKAQYNLAHPKAAGSGGGNKTLENLLPRLDPAEKNLLAALNTFKKEWAKAMRPITDEIINAMAKALPRITALFKDPKFMAALKGVGDALGSGITSFVKWMTSPAQKRVFEQFSNLAKADLPKIFTLFERILTLVEKIGLAFAPVLNDIIGKASGDFARWGVGIDKKHKAPKGFEQTAGGAFAARAEHYLETFGKFMTAFFHLIGTIISIAAGPGGTALENMTKTFQRWNRELNTIQGRKAGTEFFSNAVKVSGQILGLLGKFIGVLFTLTKGESFSNFVKLLSGPGAGALTQVGIFYGYLFKILNIAAGNKYIGFIFEELAAVFIAAKLVPGFGLAMRALAGLFKLSGKGIFKMFGARGDTPVNPLYVKDVSGGLGGGGKGGPGGVIAAEEKGLSKWAISRAGLAQAFKTVMTGGLADAFGTIAAGGVAGAGAAVVAILGGAAVGAFIGNWVGGLLTKHGLQWIEIFNPKNHNLGSKIAGTGLSIALTPVRGFVDSIKSLKDLFTGHPIGALKDLLDIVTNPFKGWFGGGSSKVDNALVVDLKTGKHYKLDLKKYFGQSEDISKIAPPKGFAWVDSHGKLTGYSKSHKAEVQLQVHIAEAGKKNYLKIGADVVRGIASGVSNTIADVFGPSKLSPQLQKGIIDPIKAFFGIFSPARKMVPIGISMAEGMIKGWKDDLAGFFGDVGNYTDWARNNILNPLNTWRDQVTADGNFFWGLGNSMATALDRGFEGVTKLVLACIDSLPKAMETEATKLHKKFAKVGNIISRAVVGGLSGLEHSVAGMVSGAASQSISSAGAAYTGSAAGPTPAGRGALQTASYKDTIKGNPALLNYSPPGMHGMSAAAWGARFLQTIGAPVNPTTINFMILWQKKENTAANYNPLATITKEPGSTDFNYNGGYPVQNFKNVADGLRANAYHLERYTPGLWHALQNPRSDLQSLNAALVQSGWGSGNVLDVGGEIKGAMGAAVPIVAHAGEWILNTMQQLRLAKMLRKPPGLIKQALFGPQKPKRPSRGLGGDVPTPGLDAARRARALLKSTAGNRYFGPQVNNWADALNLQGADASLLGYMGGREQRTNNPLYEPIFVDTPLHQWVELGAGAVGHRIYDLLQRGHGFYLPEFVKRAFGFAHATRSQIQAWKTSNVLAGLQGIDPGFQRVMLQNILKSPLWNYASGGEVGWEPTMQAMPHFAAGGVVTTPAASPPTTAGTHVQQQFQIQTASPHIDIDYIMRRAKVIAEGSY